MFRWLKKFLRIITFLLPSFVGIVFFTNNTFATSVSCTNLDSFVSSGSAMQFVSSYCDTSSLDSSKDWYYFVDYTVDISYASINYNRSISIYSVNDSTCVNGGSCYFGLYPNLLPLIFIPEVAYNDSYNFSFSHLISDSSSNRIIAFDKVYLSSVGFNYSSFLTLNSFTISDEVPSGGSSTPVEPDCPEIPENPYDNKLDEIKFAIYAIGGVMLVIYFFYAIYKMIIGGTK